MNYRRADEFENDPERFNYLYGIHNAMLARFSKSHVFVERNGDSIVSEVYNKDDVFLYFTAFDEAGEPIHFMYDVEVAVRSGMFEIELKNEIEKEIEQRRSQIQLVEDSEPE